MLVNVQNKVNQAPDRSVVSFLVHSGLLIHGQNALNRVMVEDRLESYLVTIVMLVRV